jgi:hypothetical protein
MEFKLKTPSWRMYIISTVLIVLMLADGAGLKAPIVHPIFENNKLQVAFIAWLLLFVGVTFEF